MFRRHWTGLPKDASFVSDLKGLGYFINDQDEIRSIENPDCYFQYFLNKNARVNERQRFHFNRALEDIVHQRLEKRGLEKVIFPSGATPSQPHVSIFASPDIDRKSRIVVIFGEPTQDLGILAGRVANGPGGINKGTVVSVVEALQAQPSSDTDPSPPGIILANTGQLYWWPDEECSLTITESVAIPLPSLVHAGRRYVSSVNDIPGNENPAKHMEYILQQFVSTTASRCVKLDIIGIGQSCDTVEKFFDDEHNWQTWKGRLSAMLLLGSVYPTEELKNSSFKEFLAKRTRGYINSSECLDTPVASPAGNPNEGIPALGSPCYSCSEPYYTEMILITALVPALNYLQDVATTPGYENPPVVVAIREPAGELTDDTWDAVPEEQKPSMSLVDSEAMMQEVKQLRRWTRFEKTGIAPESDSDESDNAGDV